MSLFLSPYEPRYFAPAELVSKPVYEAVTALAKALYADNQDMRERYIRYTIYSLFEPDLLKSLDFLRELYGPAIINNWKNNGDFQQRGMRTPESEYYNPGSMHSLRSNRLVGACDLSFSDYTAEEIREDIKKRESEGESMPFTRMEDEVTWIHVDVKETGLDKVYFFKP